MTVKKNRRNGSKRSYLENARMILRALPLSGVEYATALNELHRYYTGDDVFDIIHLKHAVGSVWFKTAAEIEAEKIPSPKTGKTEEDNTLAMFDEY